MMLELGLEVIVRLVSAVIIDFNTPGMLKRFFIVFSGVAVWWLSTSPLAS